jgi:hypothetical protein
VVLLDYDCQRLPKKDLKRKTLRSYNKEKSVYFVQVGGMGGTFRLRLSKAVYIKRPSRSYPNAKNRLRMKIPLKKSKNFGDSIRIFEERLKLETKSVSTAF